MEMNYRKLLDVTYRRWRPRLCTWLRRAYPKACRALIEDAVGDAFLDALADPTPFVQAYQQGQEAALGALLKTVSWRKLRAQYRRKSSQCELPGDDHLARANAPITSSPATLVQSYQTLARTLTLVEEAAGQFGGKHPEALAAALYMRISGSSDTEAARAHNVPREYVNRAKRWIGNHLNAPCR